MGTKTGAELVCNRCTAPRRFDRRNKPSTAQRGREQPSRLTLDAMTCVFPPFLSSPPIFPATALQGGAGVLLPAAAIEDGRDVGPDGAGRQRGVHALVDAELAVVVEDGRRLLVVRHKALLQRLHVVVGPPDQRLARDVVDARVLRRVELGVVRWQHTERGVGRA